MGVSRWWSRLAAGVVWAAAVVMLSAAAAQAHATIETSEPRNGERVTTAPSAVVLHLTESVEPGRTTVQLLDADGRVVRTGAVAVTAEPGGLVGGSVALRIPVLGVLSTGEYHLTWRTVSTADMHATYGTLGFGVGPGAPLPGEDPDGEAAGAVYARPGEAALRWLGFLGLAAVLGTTVLSLLTRSPSGGGRRPVLAWRAGAIAVVTGLGLCLLLAGRDPSVLWHTRSGRFWLLHLGLLAAAVLVHRWRSGRAGPGFASGERSAAVAVLVLGSGSALAAGAVGHAAAAGGAWVALQAGLHLLATAIWSGLVVGLVAGWLAGSRPGPALARRTAFVAVPAGLASAVTGLSLAGVLVPSVGALTDSGYGRLVIAKAGLLAAAAAFGLAGYLRFRTSSGEPTRPPRTPRSLGWEAGALLAALAGAAVLATVAPPTSSRWAPTPEWTASSGPVSAQAADILATIEVNPNRAGQTFVSIDVHSTRRPDPGPVTAVEVGVPGGDFIRAQPVGAGTWTAPVRLTRPGPVSMSLRVARAGLDEQVLHLDWTLAPATGTFEAGARTAPVARALQATLLAAAGLLLLARLARRGHGAVLVGAGWSRSLMRPEIE